MQCRFYQHENPDRPKLCLECGAALPARCARCDTELPARAKFCLECRAAVASGESLALERAPRDYTKKHLAEKIFRSKSALESERKQVVVLFADVGVGGRPVLAVELRGSRPGHGATHP